MATLTATFEAGTNGNNILATDPGSASAWDAVTIVNNTGRPPTAKYDTTHVGHGSLAAKIDVGSTDVAYCEWSAAFGTQTDHYGRLYLYLTAYPVSTLSSSTRA